MHILAIESGTIDDGESAVDLGQSPAEIIILSAADTELALLSRAYAEFHRKRNGDVPSLRLANYLKLRHNYSVDLYIERTLQHARCVVLRLLGGASYWAYGVERICETAKARGQILLALPGDDKPDAALFELSTVPHEDLLKLWRCLSEGGPGNALRFFEGLTGLLKGERVGAIAQPLPKAGVYRSLTAAKLFDNRSIVFRAVLIFYRALMQAGDLAPVDTLIDALALRGFDAEALYVSSLREEAAADFVRRTFVRNPPDVILNATAFATGEGESARPFGTDAPWLQVVFSGQSRETWESSTAGLSPHYIAMHVALPELDGRILTRAVGFKQDVGRDPLTELHVVEMQSAPDRAEFVADLALGWARLRRTPRNERRIGLILANYPNRDSRIGNGVGLDTPESAVVILKELKAAGYELENVPSNSDQLRALLASGPTNERIEGRRSSIELHVGTYRKAFADLPPAVQDAVLKQWGPPESDPFFSRGSFHLTLHQFGNVVIGIQPARGYNIDPKSTYHDPALVPPHGYLAFYIWLREVFGAHAVIHLGKHGNLEWLPGKALALSANCFPEAVLGPIPNIYPFIVNDPGEGAQAKRRTSAVIIDHLTPPLTRAESYGELRELEGSVDEYYDASRLDRRRAEHLGARIIAEAERLGLDQDCGISRTEPITSKLQKLDAYLCELKEMQIRGGLHIFGRTPEGQLRTDLLAALVRVPRGPAPSDASIHRALAGDLGLGDFDPLDCAFGEPWRGPRPQALAKISSEPWRTCGDTVERFEKLVIELIEGRCAADPAWRQTAAVLEHLRADIAPRLDACGTQEIEGLLTALDGCFVSAGPSGAPTRGRPDVLPTGRNFYSIDNRTVPTPTAWELGKASAEQLVTRYLQEHGTWPKAIALSAWGTSNMRTGGDDLAQALALMGARPQWEPSSRRVTGFEILPLAQLGRPRIDVTLRVSGFFRDAFPAQITLIDSVVRAIAARDEPEEENPIRARVLADAARLAARGVPVAIARRRASHRVFGAKPGAYGAGLQAMFDERLWKTEKDLAEAFLVWGHYAYAGDTPGAPERELFETRLRQVDAIVHNQDNREHDILDSDDYYQFAGGLAVTARVLKGERVPVYHGDHSRPERPVIRRLEEEIGRVVRARAVNPKWIEAMMRHGYKGAFEIAATVDYLFAFAATTGAVRDHHFEAVYNAYIADERVRNFIAEKNPGALRDIAERLKEAIDRGLWSPASNSAYARLDELLARRKEPSNDLAI
jgi:cobaltochelatase CobN